MPVPVHYPTLKQGDFADLLRAALTEEVELLVGEARDHADAKVYVGGLPQRAELESYRHLQHLIIPWSGLPTPTRELLADFPEISVHNLHHNAAPVAEHAMALLLAAARRVIPADRALRRGDWSSRFEEPWSPLLAGRRVLILGAGAVGRRLARACEGLEMRSHLVGRHARSGVHGVDELDGLLPRCEVILIALPETPETAGLLDARRLGLLPMGALLVNVGRAAVIDELALFEALRDSKLGAAGLDVWYRYPSDEAQRTSTAPANQPFETLDNVVLSPHRAGHGAATARLRAEALAELLNRAARGDELPDRVSVERRLLAVRW